MNELHEPTPQKVWMLADQTGLAAEESTTVQNGRLVNVHNRTACAGRNCWVHDPTPGVMTSWPVRWREDKGTAERICPHGIGHPDVDDVAYNALTGRDVSLHACDGCCQED